MFKYACVLCSGIIHVMIYTHVLLADVVEDSKILKIYIWEEYLNPELYTEFESLTGIKVMESTYASNEEMYEIIKKGDSGFDIIVPTDYMLSILIKEGELAQFNPRELDQFVHMDTEFLNKTCDPEGSYSVPYLWGVTGLGFNDKYFETPPNTWAHIFEPYALQKIKGKVSVLDDMREVIGAALLFLGNNPNTTDPLEIQKVKYVLSQQNQFLKGRDSESYEAALVSEDVILAHGWSGDIFTAQSENENIQFVLPKEGSFLFIDNFAILVEAPHIAEAKQFINFMMQPEIAAKNAVYVMYPTPNAGARKFISEKNIGASFNLPLGYKVFSIRDIGNALIYYEKLWKEITS